MESMIIASDHINLTNCAREQIYIPDSIQLYDVIIFLDQKYFQIVRISANIYNFLATKLLKLINIPLLEISNTKIIKKNQYTLNQDLAAINPQIININNQCVNLNYQENNNLIILGFEAIYGNHNTNCCKFCNPTQKVINAMQFSINMQKLSELIALAQIKCLFITEMFFTNPKQST
ncbi:MAG: hypothetical protein F6K62_02905 [Sphaerospermopsis sp. SIO1G2]|nr:hypothetical protein [Sphaerospermopsis sp. SIO1G2]